MSSIEKESALGAWRNWLVETYDRFGRRRNISTLLENHRGFIRAHLVNGSPTGKIPTWAKSASTYPANVRSKYIVDSVGWPYRALGGECVIDTDPFGNVQLADSIIETRWAVPIGYAGWQGDALTLRVLPLRILWRGFVANSLLFAAPLCVGYFAYRVLQKWNRCMKGICSRHRCVCANIVKYPIYRLRIDFLFVT